MHKVLVNCLVKLAQERVSLCELTVQHDHPGMNIAVDCYWDVKKQTKQKSPLFNSMHSYLELYMHSYKTNLDITLSCCGSQIFHYGLLENDHKMVIHKMAIPIISL